MLFAAAARGPERFDLGEDPLAEVVAGPGERERRVGMQALHRAGLLRPRDPDVELRAEAPLLRVGGREARAERLVLTRRVAVAGDAAIRLEARDRRDQPGAGQVVGRRERPAGRRERRLLGDRRKPVRAAASNAPKKITCAKSGVWASTSAGSMYCESLPMCLVTSAGSISVAE